MSGPEFKKRDCLQHSSLTFIEVHSYYTCFVRSFWVSVRVTADPTSRHIFQYDLSRSPEINFSARFASGVPADKRKDNDQDGMVKG